MNITFSRLNLFFIGVTSVLAINALNYEHQLAAKIDYPVTVQQRGIYHVVRIGPMQTATEMHKIKRIVSGSVYVSDKTQKPTLISMNNAQPAPMHVNVGLRDKDGVLSTETNRDHFDIIGALGVATIGNDDSTLRLSALEKDRVVQTNSGLNKFTAQLGVGYVHYFSDTWQSANVKWFPSIEPELNVYYLGGSSINGDVLQFENPQLNNLTYSMPFNSTRLMADAALTIATLNKFSIYGKGGLGNAWSRIGYSDTFNDAGSRLDLNAIHDSSFVWEAGAGMQYAVNHRMGIGVEYLYTALGRQKVSSHANGTSASVVVPGSFHMNTQAALFSLHVACDD